MAEVDSDAGEVQTTEGESDSPENAPGVDRELYLGETEPEEEQPATAPIEEKSSETTTEPVKSQAEIESGLRLDDYTRKTQALAEERREFESRMAAFEERQKAYEERQKPTEVPLSQRAQNAIADPNLDETSRAVIGAIAESASMIEALQQEVAQLRAFRENVEPQFDSVVATTRASTEKEAARAMAEQEREVTAAIDEFGFDTVKRHANTIKALAIAGQINPSTGQVWKMRDVVALVEQTALKNGAATENKTARKAAQAEVAGNGLIGTPVDSGTRWSSEQAIAEIARTM